MIDLNVKFLKIKKEDKEKDDGTEYSVIRVDYSEGGEERFTNVYISKFNKKLIDKLKKLEKGDKVVFAMEKNGKYLNLKDVLKPGEKSPQSTSKGGNDNTSDNIARAVALKAAVDMLKGETDTKKVIKTAKELESYLKGEETTPVSKKAKLKDPEEDNDEDEENEKDSEESDDEEEVW